MKDSLVISTMDGRTTSTCTSPFNINPCFQANWLLFYTRWIYAIQTQPVHVIHTSTALHWSIVSCVMLYTHSNVPVAAMFTVCCTMYWVLDWAFQHYYMQSLPLSAWVIVIPGECRLPVQWCNHSCAHMNAIFVKISWCSCGFLHRVLLFVVKWSSKWVRQLMNIYHNPWSA